MESGEYTFLIGGGDRARLNPTTQYRALISNHASCTSWETVITKCAPRAGGREAHPLKILIPLKTGKGGGEGVKQKHHSPRKKKKRGKYKGERRKAGREKESN
jgi:hypothetical protein